MGEAIATPQNNDTNKHDRLKNRFNSLLQKQYWNMMYENIAPKAVPILSIMGLYAGSAMSGAWAYLPPEGKLAGLVCFGAAAAVSAIKLFTIKLPSKADAARRLDEVSPTEHQIAENVYKDSLKQDNNPLWRIHMESLYEKVSALTAEPPRENPALQNMLTKLLLPAAVVLGLGGVTGYGDYQDNIKQSFSGVSQIFEAPPPVPSRLNAWITQPGYTGEFAPITLFDAQQGALRDMSQPLQVIEGSILTVQFFDEDTTINAKAENDNGDFSMVSEKIGNTREITITLSNDTDIAIARDNWQGFSWQFDVTDDLSPEIRINPLETEGSAPPAYNIEVIDDFGARIRDGKAVIDAPVSNDPDDVLPQYRNLELDLGIK